MLYRLFILLFLLLNGLLASAQGMGELKSRGALDGWTYNQSTKELTLQGWSLVGGNGDQPPALILSMEGQTYDSAESAPRWVPRPDISAGHSLAGGQAVLGFDWHVELREALPAGVNHLQLVAVFPDGERFAIKGAFAETPTVVVSAIKRRHWNALVAVLLGIVTIVYVRRKWGRQLSTRLHSLLSGFRMAWCIGGAFVILVGLGVTGSSMDVLFNSTYGKSILDVQGPMQFISHGKAVRGDEWGVQLPNLLAQMHHEPRFPVINDLLGEGGQNMGVIGMTGVPIQQWAALARPATWGYFVLPLRQAMAWHWQLPFWGCLVALWCMLNVLRPAQRGLNLALSLAFCVAPYASAWSNWPLYVTMFPAFAFVVTAYLLRTDGLLRGLMLGAVLGWLLAAWSLVLYPAWIIVVGSALAFIGLGWCIDNRRDLRFGWAQVLALAVCALVLGALLGSWWLDTKDAIALMKATEYPGRRGAMPGGDLSWWWHLRGNHAFESMRETGPHSNPSEASSYLIFPVSMAALAVLSLMRDNVARWTVLGCAAFMGCYWFYTMVGIPVELARVTLWGNMPAGRMDVGMGLVGAVILCLFALNARAPASWVGRITILILALMSAGLAASALLHTPSVMVPNAGTTVLVVVMALAAALVVGWTLWGRLGSALALTLLLYMLASLQFNPLSIAPKAIELSERHRSFVSDNAGKPQRTLVLNGDGIGAMTLAAVGIPIANGVFYYPHTEFWARMRLEPNEWSKVNRYQHLGFYIMDDLDEPRGFRVNMASIDQVHVHVSPGRFNFSCTGATRVVAPAQWKDALSTNSGLRPLGGDNHLFWFAVKPTC